MLHISRSLPQSNGWLSTLNGSADITVDNSENNNSDDNIGIVKVNLDKDEIPIPNTISTPVRVRTRSFYGLEYDDFLKAQSDFNYNGSSLLGKKMQQDGLSVRDDYELDTGIELEDNLSVAKPPALVIVDPWSTGNRLCREIVQRDIDLIVVWMEDNVRSKTLPASETILHYDSAYLETLTQIKRLNEKYDIKAILAGSETGVILAEQLANSFGLPSNPPSLSFARRNKYLMGETLRKKGVRAVIQTISTDFKVVKDFLQNTLKLTEKDDNTENFKVILKPNMGAGSDDVFLCKNMAEVEKNFNTINGKINSLGLKNDGVLVQEYLDGKEYVVDAVSRNGNHKIVALWEYDKRPVNGRFNIYHGNFPLVMKPGDKITKDIVAYMMQVLDALEFKNGPSHAEVKMTRTGPCLVEIGARCHGGNGTWADVARASWDFDQISHLIDSFAPHPDRRSHIEKLHSSHFPSTFKGFGCVLDLICYQTGEIVEIPGTDKVKNMKSFFSMEFYKKPGDQAVVTVDCNTTPGQVVLIHEREDVVRQEYDEIHRMLQTKNEFFILKQ